MDKDARSWEASWPDLRHASACRSAAHAGAAKDGEHNTAMQTCRGGYRGSFSRKEKHCWWKRPQSYISNLKKSLNNFLYQLIQICLQLHIANLCLHLNAPTIYGELTSIIAWRRRVLTSWQSCFIAAICICCEFSNSCYAQTNNGWETFPIKSWVSKSLKTLAREWFKTSFNVYRFNSFSLQEII